MNGISRPVAFPTVESLLEPRELRERLGPITDRRATLVGVVPHYLRIKPGTSALLGLIVTWRDAAGSRRTRASLYVGEGAAAAADKAASLRLLEPEHGPAMARLEGALYLGFPNDRELRGLAAAADTRRLGNRLTREGSPLEARGIRVSARRSQLEILRWKPGRRAVIRAQLSLSGGDLDGRQPSTRYVRVFPSALLAERLAGWVHAARHTEGLAPKVVDVDAERGLFVTEAADGEGILVSSVTTASNWRGLAAALGAIHGTTASEGLSLRSDSHLLAAAQRSLDLLSAVDSSFAMRANRLSARLEALQSELPDAPAAFVHGDLTADQILVNGARVVLLDWDEAAIGDPHADYASLRADLRERGRTEALAVVDGMVCTGLAERFEPARWQWQAAAAEARLALSALQRGRPDWRSDAEAALEASERQLSAVPVRRVGSQTRPKPDQLWDSSFRSEWVATGERTPELAAVWPERPRPDGPDVVVARFEDSMAPGSLLGWLRLSDRVEWFPFPQDPALPGLARRISSGAFALGGHRLGKRAALRALDGRGFLYLRPKNSLAQAYQTVVDAHLSLQKAGVVGARPLGLDHEGDGWWAESIPGRVIGVTDADAPRWRELGGMLASVHAVIEPGADTPVGFGASVNAARRQLRGFALGDPRMGGQLMSVLDRVAAAIPANGRPAFVHGDLHRGQVVVGDRTVILDWERSRLGEAEEDLGNLAAHLVWECEIGWRVAWDAFVGGYRDGGGRFDPGTLWAYAKVALIRVLAVHGWRDAGRQRVTDLARWASWFETRGWE